MPTSTIASAINFVLQLNRMSDGTRRVTSIAEVTGMEADVVTMQDIFVFEKTGRDENGRILGQFKATGVRPKAAQELMAAGIDLNQISFRQER